MRNIKSHNPDSIREAYRYLANAKQTIRNSPIEYGTYTDSKYVQEAAGIGYLSALKAIDVFLFSKGVSIDDLPKSIEEYRDAVRKKMPHNGKLMAALHIVYYNLHRLAYYQGAVDVILVKTGFENCKKIISMIENSLGKSSSQSMVNEPQEKYFTKKSKKRKSL